MKYFVAWDKNPKTSFLIDKVKAIVVEAETTEEGESVRQRIKNYRTQPYFRNNIVTTFIFLRPIVIENVYKLNLTEEHPQGAARLMLALNGRIFWMYQHIGFFLYEVERVNEKDFYSMYLDRLIFTNALTCPKDTTIKCQHHPGSTLIFGHRICKFCGIDLD